MCLVSFCCLIAADQWSLEGEGNEGRKCIWDGRITPPAQGLWGQLPWVLIFDTAMSE